MILMFKYDWDLTWTPTQFIIYETLTTMRSFNLQHKADPIQHSKPQTNTFEMFW